MMAKQYPLEVIEVGTKLTAMNVATLGELFDYMKINYNLLMKLEAVPNFSITNLDDCSPNSNYEPVSIWLKSYLRENKIRMIKAIRSIQGSSLIEAKNFVESAQFLDSANTISSGNSRLVITVNSMAEAKDYEAQLIDAGGQVELKQ